VAVLVALDVEDDDLLVLEPELDLDDVVDEELAPLEDDDAVVVTAAVAAVVGLCA
jgi:hypothetical protein